MSSRTKKAKSWQPLALGSASILDLPKVVDGAAPMEPSSHDTEDLDGVAEALSKMEVRSQLHILVERNRLHIDSPNARLETIHQLQSRELSSKRKTFGATQWKDADEIATSGLASSRSSSLMGTANDVLDSFSIGQDETGASRFDAFSIDSKRSIDPSSGQMQGDTEMIVMKTRDVERILSRLELLESKVDQLFHEKERGPRTTDSCTEVVLPKPKFLDALDALTLGCRTIWTCAKHALGTVWPLSLLVLPMNNFEEVLKAISQHIQNVSK